MTGVRRAGAPGSDGPLGGWFVYLIECRDGSIYTGMTVDVAARYAAHRSGKGARYTRSHPPKRLLAVFEFANRSAAAKAESAIRRLSHQQKRVLCPARAPADPRAGGAPWSPPERARAR